MYSNPQITVKSFVRLVKEVSPEPTLETNPHFRQQTRTYQLEKDLLRARHFRIGTRPQ